MNIDYSLVSAASASSSSSFLIPEVTEQREQSSARTIALTPLERQGLRVKGFSHQEIDSTVKSLQDRAVTVSFDQVLRELNGDKQPLKNGVKQAIERLIKETSGVQTRAQLAHWLSNEVTATESSIKAELNQHYASLWPDKNRVAILVNKWPARLQSEASKILQGWPQLNVNDDVNIDFTSTTDICGNYYNYSYTRNRYVPQINYLTFVKLVKDIWFDGISHGNTEYINRISHLLIAFTKHISDNDSKHEGSTREKRHIEALRTELTERLETTDDIGALAFLMVTHPSTWSKNKEAVFSVLIDRALNRKIECLAPGYTRWQTKEQRNKVAKETESHLIPEVTILVHYLQAVEHYIQEHLWKLDATFPRKISYAHYFDRVTHQLSHPLIASNWKSSPPLKAVTDTLNKIYQNPDYQHLFHGTPEYKSLMIRKKWKQVIGKVIRNNWDKKNQAARKAIDSTLEKARKQKNTLTRFANLINLGMADVHQRDKRRSDEIKAQFDQQGLDQVVDADGQISYGKDYYLLRKEEFNALKQHKEKAEAVTGTKIPFEASRSQINEALQRFEQLAVEEQRYWQMSRTYAKNTAIPQLIKDLPFSRTAHEHQEFQEKAAKFITCKCSTCTICDVGVYLCQCDTSLGKKLSIRLSRYMVAGLRLNIKKDVERYIASNFCTQRCDRKIALPAQGSDHGSSEGVVSSDDHSAAAPLITTVRTKRLGKPIGDGASLTKRQHLSPGSADTALFAQCTKKHISAAGPEKVLRRMADNIFGSRLAKIQQSRGNLWQAEAAGERGARHFYSEAGVPAHITSRQQITTWFDKHPKEKQNAQSLLQTKFTSLRHSIDSQTLVFSSTTFQKLKCKQIYHNLDDFQHHLGNLGRLGYFIKHPRLPLTDSTKGLYLHKTFCLACRTNFGQPQELKNHLKTHEARRLAVFREIKQSEPQPPEASPMDNPEQFLLNSDNKELAEIQLNMYQQDREKQREKLFWDLTV